MSLILDLSDLECPICRDIFQNPVQVSCLHTFCDGCISVELEKPDAKCPLCQSTMTRGHKRAVADKARLIATSKGRCSGCENEFHLTKLSAHCSTCPKSKVSYKFQPVAPTSQPIPEMKNRSTFKCPYCDTTNLDNKALLEHCNSKHKKGRKDMVCPICASMPWGDPALRSSNFLDHLNTRHKFEYDTYVAYDQDDDEQLQAALQASMMYQ